MSLGSTLATLVLLAASASAADTDVDGIDAGDNCPTTFNPLQDDCNADAVGDACTAAGSPNADADGDHVCNGVDSCVNAANVDQGDCNGNNVGDLCEAAHANRDDDRDGVCNGVDTCPAEAVASCGMQAITVPWVPANPSIPHPTYSGANHTLKGIARYGGNQYSWDYGDGTGGTGWLSIANPYNLGANHVYNGAVGQTFIATLSVRNSNNTAVFSTAIYRVKIGDSGALPPNGQMDPNRMDIRIDMAVDQGLWYLHTQMSRGTYGDGAPGYVQPYGNWPGNFAGSCTALDAFLLHGSKPNKDYATDPYVETSQRALNYILANTQQRAIAPQPAGNPDYNRNGTGLVFAPVLGTYSETYVGGICGVAVASSGTPTRQSLVGAANVRGRTYKDLVQDMAELFAWGQADTNDVHRGGWHYFSNMGNADGSTNQWPILAIAAGEDNMSITTPRFVRTEAPFFMNYTRHGALDAYNGGWGYSSNNNYINHVKTASGILYHYFEGNSVNHPEVKSALGWLYRFWAANSYGGGPGQGGNAWNVGIGNSYAMYGVMKAMRMAQPNILRINEYNYNTSTQTANSFDWYYTPPGQTQEGLATNLVKRQAASGAWSDTVGNNANALGAAGTTGWDVLILQKGVTTIPPEAEICDCTLTWNNNQSVTLDGSCSNHPDLNRAIISYEWDFNYLDNTFTADATGIQGTKVGGYPAYGTYPVALRVTDDNPIALGGPQTSLATCSIRITPPNNCPHPDAGGPYLGTHDDPFALDARASFDPDGDPLEYAWDLDNDGVFGEPGDAVGAQPSVSFANPGTFTIGVRVTDQRIADPSTPNSGPCSRVAYSTVEIGNHAPVADPGGPYAGRPGQPIMLDGTESADPDGDAITFGWDLNNDGVFTDSSMINPVFTIPATAVVGTVYSVCLKVTDELGRVSDPRCTTVAVQHVNTPPTCTIPAPAVVGECNGANVTVTVDGIQTQDADGDALTYRWTTTCPGGAFANPAAAMTTLTLSSAEFACTLGCAAVLTVSDGRDTTTCQRLIAVVDETNPTFATAPADVTLECDSGAQAAVAAWLGGAAATDSCTSASLANDFVDVVGGCGGATGATTVTWTATDTCGNDAQASATLTVTDTSAPTVACPAAATLECTGVQTPVTLAATARDACLGDVPADGPADATYPVGVTAVAFGSTDSCGNTGTCESSVTITDRTPPTLACPVSIVVECNDEASAEGINGGTATATDVCGGANVVSDRPTLGTYPLGMTTTTHTATDAHGNDSTCTSTVTVADTTAPTFDCPADVVVECNAQGGATGVNPGQATATDVCSTFDITDAPIATYPLGTNAATHSVVDAAGNGTSCANLITVRDTTAPVFDPASLGPRTVLGNCAGSAVAFALPTATDVCQATAVTCTSVGGDSVGANTVTCTATDAGGNTTTATITVHVLAPLRLAFVSPLEDDNVANDVATDADIANVFKQGSTVPHHLQVFACNGANVTNSVASQVTLRLTETYRSSAVSPPVAIVPEYIGQGDAGGVLPLVGSHFKYNLKTNSGYPAGTVNTSGYFSSLVTATYNSAPHIIAGREDARLESK